MRKIKVYERIKYRREFEVVTIHVHTHPRMIIIIISASPRGRNQFTSECTEKRVSKHFGK